MAPRNPLILYLPLTLTFLSFAIAGWIQETWSITQLTTHFMGTSSGMDDGAWPPDSGFPSSANFVLRQSFRKGPAVGGLFRESARVEHYDVSCGRTWMAMLEEEGGVVVDEGDMGEGGVWVGCGEGRNGSGSLGWRFRIGGLTDGERAGPMGFLLEVGSVG
ncbi:hypothetical protein E2P81_ATG06790 [Venturia nashicola]|uniref:Uncharacterized protein n=1 Tax=Venturia nashicola TaxID=86259 RepID=A0A4Z1NWY5_9PEZI|nr:hypothetical protein E6O75_ATG06960 [Venturia nashicola]TLD30137.1 hypothetical protein E2P81_ATG06790 [Venturia nashicola]